MDTFNVASESEEPGIKNGWPIIGSVWKCEADSFYGDTYWEVVSKNESATHGKGYLVPEKCIKGNKHTLRGSNNYGKLTNYTGKYGQKTMILVYLPQQSEPELATSSTEDMFIEALLQKARESNGKK